MCLSVCTSEPRVPLSRGWLLPRSESEERGCSREQLLFPKPGMGMARTEPATLSVSSRAGAGLRSCCCFEQSRAHLGRVGFSAWDGLCRGSVWCLWDSGSVGSVLCREVLVACLPLLTIARLRDAVPFLWSLLGQACHHPVCWGLWHSWRAEGSGSLCSS